MKTLIDTNVFLDVYQNRDPFAQFSSQILRLAESRKIKAYITANSITDLYYVLSRSLKDREKLYSVIDILLQLVDIIDVTAEDIKEAFHPEMVDFEDELIIVCAKNANIDNIITRNVKDFAHSPIAVVTPEEFIKTFYGMDKK